MTASGIRLLRRLARFHSIQTSYLDVTGQRREASPASLIAVLKALGIETHGENAIRDSLVLSQRHKLKELVEPIGVAWEGGPGKIELRIPRQLDRRRVQCKLRLEDGRRQEWSFRADALRDLAAEESDGSAYFTKQLLLPSLPFGYHECEITIGNQVSNSLIIAAPIKSYRMPLTSEGITANRITAADPRRPRTPRAPSPSPEINEGSWGLFLPMYAAHSRESWGAGTFTDWQQLTEWVGSLGGRFVGTLPLLAAFLDEPFDPSPYSPASRLFWNEFYLDITRVPEFAVCQAARRIVAGRAFQARLATFRKAALVDYREEMAAKRKVLAELSEFFFSKESQRRRPFEEFRRNHPNLDDYASFRATCEMAKTSWHSWPDRLREGNLRREDFRIEAKRYHMYVQWLAHEQMSALLERCRSSGVQLYLDLPVGVHPDSYDVWRHRDSFASGANSGAPPDAFFTKGQDWGFPPLHPRAIRQRRYGYVLDYLRFQMQHTGLLRIDHVMGLHRLYWIPHGLPASQGAYVQYPAEELHALLSLESHRHKTVIVGENLGTVPPEVNASMNRHRLRKMYVVQYECRADPKQALPLPSPLSVASLNTHDMPTFAAFWKGRDIADRVALGLIERNAVKRERALRDKLKRSLFTFLKHRRMAGSASSAGALEACLRYLSASDSEAVLVTLEDLWLEVEPQNVPGTSSERPNWRRKAQFQLEEIRQLKRVQKLLGEVNQIRTNASHLREKKSRRD